MRILRSSNMKRGLPTKIAVIFSSLLLASVYVWYQAYAETNSPTPTRTASTERATSVPATEVTPSNNRHATFELPIAKSQANATTLPKSRLLFVGSKAPAGGAHIPYVDKS